MDLWRPPPPARFDRFHTHTMCQVEILIRPSIQWVWIVVAPCVQRRNSSGRCRKVSESLFGPPAWRTKPPTFLTNKHSVGRQYPPPSRFQGRDVFSHQAFNDRRTQSLEPMLHVSKPLPPRPPSRTSCQPASRPRQIRRSLFHPKFQGSEQGRPG